MLFCYVAVEDLMVLVQQCDENPELEHQLREVLNMSRDSEKWRNFKRVLEGKVSCCCM